MLLSLVSTQRIGYEDDDDGDSKVYYSQYSSLEPKCIYHSLVWYTEIACWTLFSLNYMFHAKSKEKRERDKSDGVDDIENFLFQHLEAIRSRLNPKKITIFNSVKDTQCFVLAGWFNSHTDSDCVRRRIVIVRLICDLQGHIFTAADSRRHKQLKRKNRPSGIILLHIIIII